MRKTAGNRTARANLAREILRMNRISRNAAKRPRRIKGRATHTACLSQTGSTPR
ncbi:hypothetical protein BSIN_2620 [Burkholderia singularis]|uniref:Uncharacterized protein n=1 Tax=Burkholderia singularis TaxID=1503053 RepID=A0A238HBC6_9BURK|nr:hypothetical protein BSIN_2620 [Burkholderia singularis]